MIYSKSWSDHQKHVRITFSILRAHHLVVKREKCQFGETQVKYLGHIICSNGVKVDPDKIKAMEGWPKPSNVKALRGFLGLTGYYRKFTTCYGNIAAPLTSMLKKKSFFWNSEADMAFKLLKQSMTRAPMLALPNFTLLFIVECDASRSGLDDVLMQEQKPIAYFSTALK